MTVPILSHTSKSWKETQTHPLKISQFLLAKFAALEDELEALKAEHSQLQEQLIASLSSGARVEPGAHTAQLLTWNRRSVAWKDVVIRLKGTGYAQNVLSHTKPTTCTKLVVR